MGSNEVELAETYLEIQRQLDRQTDNNKKLILEAEMKGMIIAYEIYTHEHWRTFRELLRRYKAYTDKEE